MSVVNLLFDGKLEHFDAALQRAWKNIQYYSYLDDSPIHVMQMQRMP
jgi:hypothetical protein